MILNSISINNDANLASLFTFKPQTACVHCILWHFIEQICNLNIDNHTYEQYRHRYQQRNDNGLHTYNAKQHISASTFRSNALLERVLRGFQAIYRLMVDRKNGTSVARYQDIKQPVIDWGQIKGSGGFTMKNKMWMMYLRTKDILSSEDGQDLIEYALVVALIAFAATAGMSTLATNINTAFSNIGSKLTTYTG